MPRRNIPIASHDDTTLSDVKELHADGITLSEFPTTVEAARLARECGMKIVMGSPGIILGRSHSGNVSAMGLAHLGLLDVLTSDYVPRSLLHAAFAEAAEGFDLPKAVAMVTKNPADLLGSKDRGHIAPGLRADLLRRWRAGHPQRLGRRATIPLSRRSGAVGTTIMKSKWRRTGDCQRVVGR
ncbi:amidohydrolase family protein [Sinorhizobium sp. BJ1]|uniref:amidohydrolase family protein n=1 Tax=Sinorhizobium sp. BJ1 TaxID=2035455 RepID=UPI001FE06B8D|nr:amidohydrolase family protein [Sinorhizobium sp. BJ1]